jgi:hypothetical protein
MLWSLWSKRNFYLIQVDSKIVCQVITVSQFIILKARVEYGINRFLTEEYFFSDYLSIAISLLYVKRFGLLGCYDALYRFQLGSPLFYYINNAIYLYFGTIKNYFEEI